MKLGGRGLLLAPRGVDFLMLRYRVGAKEGLDQVHVLRRPEPRIGRLGTSWGTDLEFHRHGALVVRFHRHPLYRESIATRHVFQAPMRRKKPWRYRWPDDVRDEVLARLLELNRVRAEEEKLAGPTPIQAKEKGGKRKKAAQTPDAPALFDIPVRSS